MQKFNKPLLLTLTAPTCSGKTHLANELIRRGFQRVVGTTTREPRKGERQGVDYDFITMSRSLELEAEGKFAEFHDFNGVRYGVTKAELTAKITSERLPIMVIEPVGLANYERLCRENDWEIFKVFVETPERVCIERLNQRTLDSVFTASHIDDIIKLNKVYTSRLASITGDERRWVSMNTWDLTVSGEDLERAVTDIDAAINRRRKRDVG